MRCRYSLPVVILLCLSLPPRVFAQFDTGTVLGVVRDTSGGVLPGVTVTLRNTATALTVTRQTDERGGYEFFTVCAGDYQVIAELSGFAPRTTAVKVDVGARQRIDIELIVGSISEALTVTAFWQMDVAASKHLALGATSRIEVRIEAFNLLNRSNFRAPNGNVQQRGVRHDYLDLRPTPGPAGYQDDLVAAA